VGFLVDYMDCAFGVLVRDYSLVVVVATHVAKMYVLTLGQQMNNLN
jgi:hypothetical protein